MTKIGIVDDHAIVRSGLRQFFSEHVDLRVVGEGPRMAARPSTWCAQEIDVLVMDLSMPGQSGLDALVGAARRISAGHGHPDPERLPGGALRHQLDPPGRERYLNKECDPKEIVKAIRAIALGRRYLTPAVAERLAQQLNRKGDFRAAARAAASEREFQVFPACLGETAGISPSPCRSASRL